MSRIQIARVNGGAVPLIGLVLDGELEATMDYAFALALAAELANMAGPDPMFASRDAVRVEGNETRN